MRTRLIVLAIGTALTATACAGTSLTDAERIYCRDLDPVEIDQGAADLGIDIEPIWEGAEIVYQEQGEALGDLDAAAELAHQYIEDQGEFIEVCQSLYENR